MEFKKKNLCHFTEERDQNVKPVQWRVIKMLGTGAHDVQGMAEGAGLGHPRK